VLDIDFSLLDDIRDDRCRDETHTDGEDKGSYETSHCVPDRLNSYG